MFGDFATIYFGGLGSRVNAVVCVMVMVRVCGRVWVAVMISVMLGFNRLLLGLWLWLR